MIKKIVITENGLFSIFTTMFNILKGLRFNKVESESPVK
jgi:hypothetical protein